MEVVALAGSSFLSPFPKPEVSLLSVSSPHGLKLAHTPTSHILVPVCFSNIGVPCFVFLCIVWLPFLVCSSFDFPDSGERATEQP